MNDKKKCSIISLLLLVSMPLFFSIYTIIGKMVIEYEMEEKLETENLQTVTVEAASVVWLKQNKEILIDGEPFDIKKITRHGNKITVCGLYDLQEKALKEKMLDYQHERSSSSTGNSILLLFFTSTYCDTIEPANINCPYTILIKQHSQRHQDKIDNLYPDIVKPPPRLV